MGRRSIPVRAAWLVAGAALVAAGGALAGPVPPSDALAPADTEAVYDGAGWSPLASTPDGIEILEKLLPDSSVPAVMLRKEVAVDSDCFMEVLRDLDHFAEVSRDLYVDEARVLASGRDGDRAWEDVYTHLRFPSYLPVSSREQVLRIWTEIDTDGHHRTWWAAVPPSEYAGELAGAARGEDAVYMDRSVGGWELQPLGDGRTRVVYRSLAHPGGDLPGFLIRRSHETQLPELLRAMEGESLRRCQTTAAVSAGR